MGKWTSVPRSFKEHGYGSGLCWEAEDPQIGKVYLCFNSSTSHAKDRGNSRLRDPSGTRHRYWAHLSLRPFTYGGWEDPQIFSAVVVGESWEREKEKEAQISRKMMKLFGVDPFEWKNPKPEAPPVPESTAALHLRLPSL